MANWRERILESTRGRVLVLLRREARTVNELAAELELTDNAVRLHLAALERDGLVEAAGTRREWTGKPAVRYRTTSEAEALFPKPYRAVLAAVLKDLEGQHDRSEIERLMRRAGQSLAADLARGTADITDRVRYAAEVLTALGGLAEVVEEEGGGFRIEGFSCPLAELVTDHPSTCQLAEALVSELVGRQVVECCERGDRPRCAFRIAAA